MDKQELLLAVAVRTGLKVSTVKDLLETGYSYIENVTSASKFVYERHHQDNLKVRLVNVEHSD